MKKVHVFLVDCQMDFCDPKGALFVPGADADMARLATLLQRSIPRIDAIHPTLDSHQIMHIAHPIFWIDSSGKHPAVFTTIKESDVLDGTYMATNPAYRTRAKEYVVQLTKNGKYPLTIWPPHCLIGSPMWAIVPSVFDAINNWSKAKLRSINFQPKGSNCLTEHYSIFRADVVDPADASTMMNTTLLNALQGGDEIWIAGEALNFCVKSSVEDLIASGGEELAKKCVLLQDCSSNVPVPGYEKNVENFIKNMKALGVKFVNSTDL